MVIVPEDMGRELPVEARVYKMVHPQSATRGNQRQAPSIPVFPDIMLGATMTESAPWIARCALYVALIVPDSSWYGAASAPVGVTGAGSSPLSNASLSVSVPLAGAPSADTCWPNALYVRLNLCPRLWSSSVSDCLVSPTELWGGLLDISSCSHGGEGLGRHIPDNGDAVVDEGCRAFGKCIRFHTALDEGDRLGGADEAAEDEVLADEA